MLYPPVICRVDWTQSKLSASRLSLMAMTPLCYGRGKPTPGSYEWMSFSLHHCPASVDHTVSSSGKCLFLSFLFCSHSSISLLSLSLFSAHYFWCSFIILPLQRLAAYWFLPSCPSFLIFFFFVASSLSSHFSKFYDFRVTGLRFYSHHHPMRLHFLSISVPADHNVSSKSFFFMLFPLLLTFTGFKKCF